MRVTPPTALLGAVALALVVGCQTAPSPSTASAPASRLAPRAVSSVPLSRVTGLLTAPASLIANNSSSIVSNNSSGLIANNSSSFRLLATAAWQPAGGIRLTVTDVFGRLVRGAEATTEADGSFAVEMPTEGTWILRGHLGGVELSTLVRPAAGRTKVAVNPGTTLATQRLLKTYATRKGSLSHVPLAAFDELAAVLQASLEKAETNLDMTSADEAVAILDRVERRDEAVAVAGSALTEQTNAAVEEVLAQGLVTEAQLAAPPAEPLPEVVLVEEGADVDTADETAAPAASSAPLAPESASPAEHPASGPTTTPTPRPASPPSEALQQLLARKDCSFCEMEGADFSRANLRGANLKYADLRNANLAGASLAGANLQYADLRGADLRGASLKGVNLKYADLRDADLTGADLTRAQLKYTEFSGAVWTNGQTCASGSRGACR